MSDSGSRPEPWIWKSWVWGKGFVMGADGIMFEPNYKACNASFRSKCPCKVWTQINPSFIISNMNRSSDVCVFFQRGEEQFDWLWIRAFFCAWFCCALSLPFISSSGITGSSDQFLLMLFCCHGYQVLQYAPLVLLVQNSSLHTHRHYCSRPPGSSCDRAWIQRVNKTISSRIWIKLLMVNNYDINIYSINLIAKQCVLHRQLLYLN